MKTKGQTARQQTHCDGMVIGDDKYLIEMSQRLERLRELVTSSKAQTQGRHNWRKRNEARQS